MNTNAKAVGELIAASLHRSFMNMGYEARKADLFISSRFAEEKLENRSEHKAA